MIFISGRFRSGTTLLWNIFRSIPDICAYKEPLHSNLLTYISSDLGVDPTHKGVSDYWLEYRDISLPLLSKWHRQEFGIHKLCLGGQDHDPELFNYLVFLRTQAEKKSKIPLYKFVRADYRLPWLRKNFPDSKILNIRRNPRDNWLSIIAKNNPQDWLKPSLNTGYDLLIWSANLSQHFDFLGDGITHSYQRSYYLWKISNAVANYYADCIIDYDNELVAFPKDTIERVFHICSIECLDVEDAASKVLQTPTRTWKDFADKVPFQEIEEACDSTLALSGLLDYIEAGGLDVVGWPKQDAITYPAQLIEYLCSEISSLTQRFREVEFDSTERLKQVKVLTQMLQESETDRASRLEQIHTLTRWLQEARKESPN